MLKVDEAWIRSVEEQYPGIAADIARFEALVLPACPKCGSDDTASVQVGVIGRTIHLVAATTKLRLIPNGPRPGACYCNACREYFDPPAPAS